MIQDRRLVFCRLPYLRLLPLMSFSIFTCDPANAAIDHKAGKEKNHAKAKISKAFFLPTGYSRKGRQK